MSADRGAYICQSQSMNLFVEFSLLIVLIVLCQSFSQILLNQFKLQTVNHTKGF